MVDDDHMDLEMQLLSSPPVNNYNGGSRTRKMMRTAIIVVQSVQMLLAGTHHHGSPSVSRVSSSKSVDHSPEQPEFDSIYENMEEAAVRFVDTDQTALLIDNTLNSGKKIRTLTEIFRSRLAFKAYASTAAASAYIHQGATERMEVSGASDDLRASPEHHVTICQTTTSPIIINQLQRSQSRNISKIVRQKNLLTLQEFGGLSGAADALGTDLVKGLSDNEALYRSQQHAFSLSLPPKHTFFHLVRKEVKNKTILLVFLAVVLSIVFGINEEGLKSGLDDEGVVLIAMVLLVFFASTRKYWQEIRARKKLEKRQFTKVKAAVVLVIREGECKSIYESKLVCGDVVLLNKGSQIPADGLFVDGQPLELNYGSDPYLVDVDNPFLSYGERVINGDARMVVTSTNMETGWSEMMSKSTDGLKTSFKLETHLDKLNTCMHYTRLIISILIVLVLFIRYKVGKIDEGDGYIPESMAEPTATRTFADNFKNLIKESKYTARLLTKLLSVSLVGVTEGVPFVVSLSFYWNDEKLVGYKTNEGVAAQMALVTRICTDMFGDFTEDEMEVEMLFIGGEVISGCTTIPPNIVEALCDGIGRSKERAILHWAKDKLGYTSGLDIREETVLHFNGPVNETLDNCTHFYDLKGEKAVINDTVRRSLDQANEEMHHKKLKGIAFSCKHAKTTQTIDADDLVLVAILGLKNKNKEAVKLKVKACRESGIETVIISSKKVPVLENIALQCGVITDVCSESLVITGEVFRNYTDTERLEKVDKVRVLGEALPSDKLLFVKTLREKGEVVAFLGQRTDESPALTAANIGIAMGTWSSIKARESCDIILWDGSFADLIMMVDSGKCIYRNVQTFLQLVLITTASNTLINLVETAVSGDASLTIGQLIWVNLAVTFLGGLALLTKQSVSLGPISHGTSIITAQMIRNIVLQILYQISCSAIIQLKGCRIVGGRPYMEAVVSNILIFCQFFNVFNARELQRKNFFRGIHLHLEFWVAISSFIVLHALFVMVQDIIGYGTILNWKLWVGCVLVAVVSWPVDWFGKCISSFINRSTS